MSQPQTIRIETETWPIAGVFAISRGARREATVVVAHVSDGSATGRGECVPYARYGETVDSVRAAIAAASAIATTDRALLQRVARPGAARNALDCALWDLEAKRTGVRAATRAGLHTLLPLTTAYTLSLDAPEAMEARAVEAVARGQDLLKLKLGGSRDEERMRRVRAACPGTRLIADANEGWTGDMLEPLLAVAAECRLELIEQPLPADADDALAAVAHPVPVCADESLHTRADLARLAGRYDAVNIKLDKAGGLTESLATLAQAQAMGFKVMIGCMVGTSLAMAPALLLAQSADWVDLDGPLLLARDRDNGLRYEGGRVYPPEPTLWG
ncbi:MAG TPA: N-acetyl-D-Glu racemase DgcA [Hyphomicrobiaceae bacterium]|nr:N-acetyl-D-Glu racemase DgcA [Hyphomicrobiaceae bacterium]